MNSKRFSQELRDGKLLIGTLIASPSPMWPAAVDGIGLNYVFIDTEHIALDRSQVSWMCQVYSRMGLPPLVRIPSPDPFEAAKALDGGAAGIIAPYIETAEQVRALSGAVKFRPLKGKKLTERLAGGTLEPVLEEYLRQRNNSALIVNIESAPALDALDDILSVPGLDGVIIGPHDLTCSLGIPEQYDHKEYLSACKTIFCKARAKGIGAGIHVWGSVEDNAAFLKLGANMLNYSSDLTLYRKYLQAEICAVKECAGFGPNDKTTRQDITI